MTHQVSLYDMAVSRMVKNLEAGLIAVFTPQPSPKLWLVFCSSITHNHRRCMRKNRRGKNDGLEAAACLYDGFGRLGPAPGHEIDIDQLLASVTMRRWLPSSWWPCHSNGRPKYVRIHNASK